MPGPVSPRVDEVVSPLLDTVHMTTNSTMPVRQYPVVREHMTPSPHTIARNQPLSAAQQSMRQHQVRHLPVLDGGRIVGILSQRDLLLIESLPGVNPTDVLVEEAMVQDVFTVTPDAPIGEVIETMIDRKVGSAVVSEGERVVGVFTTIDALRALHRLLERH
jgi:acetoin utilization protein AcuB